MQTSIKFDPQKEEKLIFITGATGYLGKFILKELLQNSSETLKICCLIRAKNKEDAWDRLKSILSEITSWKEQWENQIILVKKHFG